MPRSGLGKSDSSRGDRQLPAEALGHLELVLDNMPSAIVYTDAELRIVVCNNRFKEMYVVPKHLLEAGRPYPDFLRYLAENGYYGEGDVDAMVAKRVESLRNPSGQSFEDHAPDGRWYRILRRCAPAGGTVTVMTDITDQKLAEIALADKQAQLHVALDNMPGAIVHTDANLRIVVCNDRFREMYIVPEELLQPGQLYPDFLRYLAENGYYGEGDVDALVAGRVESLRNPSGRSFEDHAPDGRWYRILRRRVAGGGAVTVMTDITDQKQAERDLLDATRRAEEANKLITEKNRALEALNAEIRDKNRKVEEQAAQIADWNARLEARVTEQVARIGPMSKLTRFLSPKISDLIMSGDADDSLARRTEITVVFVDLRGFTGFTETAEPEEVMSVLRDYHAELGREIMAHEWNHRAFRGRRRDDSVQRSRAGSTTTSCRRSAWRSRCARRSPCSRTAGRSTGTDSDSEWASPAATRLSVPSDTRAGSNTALSGRSSISPLACAAKQATARSSYRRESSPRRKGTSTSNPSGSSR